MTTNSETLADQRLELLTAFAALPTGGDVVAWQRSLANAIIEAEINAAGHDKDEIRHHRHVLRLIGDALVYTLLPSHTIRTLSRHPGTPAGISSQGEDFDFVMSCAAQLKAQGLIPIVADLTTLIGVGDVIGWNADGIIALECKNRSVPKKPTRNGRLFRQRRRGEQAEEYLVGSAVDEAEGETRIALDAQVPSPAWNDFEEVIASADSSELGCVLHYLGPRDALLVCTSRMESMEVLESVMPDAGDFALPLFASLRDAIESSDHLVRPATAYPLSPTLRHRLMEGDISVFRFVDLSLLQASFSHNGVEAELRPRQSPEGVYVDILGPHQGAMSFTPALTRYPLLMPVRLSEMLEMMLDLASVALTAADSKEDAIDQLRPADGDRFLYGTAYRSDDDDNGMLVVTRGEAE